MNKNSVNEHKYWWTDRAWRQIQTNLREIDMLDIDAERYVADLKEFKATSVLLNAAGIIASYPTTLPFHFQSPFLKGSSLKELIAACHQAGIKVIARTDFSKIRRPIYEEHPDWAYRTVRGEIVDYNGDVHACVNGDYQQKYALEIIKETLTTHDFDGIFFNMGGFQTRDYSGNDYGICHCNNCKKKMAEMFGCELPLTEDWEDPLYRKYLLFKKKILKEHQQKIYDLIQGIRPDILIANNFIQRGMVRQESNTAIDRPLPHWQFSASDNTKWVTGSYPGMGSCNTTVDFIDFPYRHVAVSPNQQKLRLAQNLANGGGIDYYLMGRIDNHEDKSGFEGIKEIFHYHAKNEEEYKNIASLAKIGLFHGSEGNVNEFRGWFRFLAENHFLFDTIMADAALELSWDKYDVIIVPDYQPLSRDLCNQLDDFVAAGGTVIAVGRAGFRDDHYERREDPAFKCLGINKIKIVRSDMRSSYFKIKDGQKFKRLPATTLIYMDGDYIYADYSEKVEKHLSLIPPQMFGPPERCYTNLMTHEPGFTINRFGKGQGIYIPWLPGQLFYRQGYSNTIDFIGDLLEHFAGIKPVGGNLPPMVEVTLFEQRNRQSYLLHLVNASGHFGVSFYAPVPIADAEVLIPDMRAPAGIKSLVTGEHYAYTMINGNLHIKIPRLDLMEAIKIVF